MITNINESLSLIDNDLNNGTITAEEAAEKKDTLIKTYVIESMAEVNIDYKDGYINEETKDSYMEIYSALFESLYEDTDEEFIRETMNNFYTEAAEKKKIKISKAEYDAIMAKKNSEEDDKEAKKARRKERLKTAGKVALVGGAAALAAVGGYKAAKAIDTKHKEKLAAAKKRAKQAAIIGGLKANKEYQEYEKYYELEIKNTVDEFDKRYKDAGTSYLKEQVAQEKEATLAKIDEKYRKKFAALEAKIMASHPDKAKLQDELEAKGKKMAHINDLEAKDVAKARTPIGRWVTKQKYKGYKKKEQW